MEENKIDTKQTEKKGKQGYSYGKWVLGKKSDSWKHLKKPWRKKWVTLLNPWQVNIEVWQIVNWMTFGKKDINEKAKKAWAIPWKPMSVNQACLEYGITHNTFYQHLKKFPEAKELFKELKEARRDYMKDLAESNIADWLSWNLWLTWKEMVDASFKLLEKTDKNYQPKLEVENKSIGINLNKSTDDIMGELSSILWLNK